MKLSNMTQATLPLWIALSLLSSFASADDLQTLKNLERERAALIQVMLDPNLDANQRNKSTETKTRRLVDLERMVLRDSRLNGNTDVMVRRAFNHYDLSFLAHASVESGHSVAGHWLNRVGLSNEAILNAKPGIR